MNRETDEQQVLAKSYRKYAGEGIDVFYNIDVCEHVGNLCKRESRSVRSAA